MTLPLSPSSVPPLPGPVRGGPVPLFMTVAVVLALAALGLSSVLGRSGLSSGLTLAVFVAISGAALWGLWHSYPHRTLGLCNIVTLGRAALVAALASVLVSPAAMIGDAGWAVVVLCTVTLALDGVDGWLARSSGLVSDFGARFDMEVDAVFAAILALAVWQSDKVGAWVLLLGAMRYLFVLASYVWPWLNAPLPENVMRRKTVCVIQISALVVLLAPVVVPPVSVLIAAAATAMLTWSFAADIVWLHRRRAA